jgi:hypothetical protein
MARIAEIEGPERKVPSISPTAIIELAMVRAVTIRSVIGTAVLLSLVVATGLGSSQSSPDLHAFFRQDIGLSEDQIVDIRSGKAVVRAMPSRARRGSSYSGRSTLTLHPKATSGLPTTSIAFASSPTIWR